MPRVKPVSKRAAKALPPRPRAPIALLGAPTEAGSNARGGVMGPQALRVAGIRKALRALGHAVDDFGDIDVESSKIDLPEPPPGSLARNWPEIRAWAALLAHRAYELMGEGYRPLFLGGDHSISIGTVSGVARACREAGRPLFVLWLDAHADFNTPRSSPSGNLHGMPLAALCGVPELADLFAADFEPGIAPDRVYLFGLRSVDPEERQLVRATGVQVMDMRRIDEQGAGPLVDQVVRQVAAVDGHLHVSLDIDSLDPSIAPGVGTTQQGGLTYREAHLIMEKLHDSGLVGSVDVVELNPFLDERGRSALLLVELVASLFGRRILE